MKTIKYLSLTLIAFVFVIGCSGNYGKFKVQTRSESKLTKRELIDNWSDYDIRVIYKRNRLAAIIFDPQNDDRKILVGRNWSKVKDQEMWTEIVKENTASDGEFTLVWYDWGPYYTTEVQEIWGLDNQLFGYVVYQEYAVVLERVEMGDDSTIRLSWRPRNTLAGNR